jgi:hypothetical protein
MAIPYGNKKINQYHAPTHDFFLLYQDQSSRIPWIQSADQTTPQCGAINICS